MAVWGCVCKWWCVRLLVYGGVSRYTSTTETHRYLQRTKQDKTTFKVTTCTSAFRVFHTAKQNNLNWINRQLQEAASPPPFLSTHSGLNYIYWSHYLAHTHLTFNLPATTFVKENSKLYHTITIASGRRNWFTRLTREGRDGGLSGLCW